MKLTFFNFSISKQAIFFGLQTQLEDNYKEENRERLIQRLDIQV